MSCAHCSSSEVFLECGNRCGTAYCNVECAKKHWGIGHKVECATLIERRSRRSRSRSPVSKKKAREILHHGEVHGHPLTDKQRRYFGYLSNK